MIVNCWCRGADLLHVHIFRIPGWLQLLGAFCKDVGVALSLASLSAGYTFCPCMKQ